MVRQKSRKTVEDLYTSVPPTSSLLATTTRFEENFFPNSKNNKNNKTNEKTDASIHINGAPRKKSKGRTPVEKKEEKTLINEETMLGRSNKSEGMCAKQNVLEENEKDEDTEEFFVQIKETVQRAVEKSLQDILVRSLREINFKIDEVLERVKANENTLEKIQTDLNNKVVHYGEENSRHFRYLCMKSEYDKMFYQHQNVMTAMPVDARPNVINPYPQQVAPSSESNPQKTQPLQQQQPAKPTKSSTMPIGCNCHNSGDFDYAQRSKLSLSSKSSDMGIKEVKDLLDQLQKFYDQHNHEKDNQRDERGNDAFNIPDQDDSADGDEDDESSDGMSTPSIEENIRIGGDA